MERLMFVDGVYPDFSLLEEVLLPPYFESGPCSSIKDVQSGEITLLAQLQYQESTRGAAVELNDSVQAADATVQYRRRATRGRKKRGANNRSSSVKVNNSCLPRTHAKKSLKIGHKMSCVTEISESGIIYLLEESIKKLPKREGNLEDDHVLKNLCSMTGELVRTPSIKNGYSMTPGPSTTTGNAMELLNLINIKCTHLNKLGGDELRIEDLDHQRRDGGGHDGHPKMAEDQISICDLLTLASANKPPKIWKSPDKNGGLLCDDHYSGAPGEVSNVDRVEDQNTLMDYGSWVRKTSRKQQTPRKGVENRDPSFKGIEFQMHLCFGKETCDDCQLIVTSCYSRGRSRRKSTKARLRFKSTSLSSGSEDDHLPAPSSRNKRCASCKTQKTPLWRDAEDGTPLCNACGIRYKKYGLKCDQCWNIPKKDGKSCSKYCGCGGIFGAPL